MYTEQVQGPPKRGTSKSVFFSVLVNGMASSVDTLVTLRVYNLTVQYRSQRYSSVVYKSVLF